MSTPQRDARWVAQTLLAGAPVKVGEPDLTQLARNLHSVTLDAGAVLYRADGAVGGVWIVRSGQVEVSRGAGRKRCVAQILREGDVIGDVYLLLQIPASVTARCTETTSCWFVEADDFRGLIARYPSIAVAWACNLAHRLCESRDHILNCVGGTLSQRLAGLLVAEREGTKVRVPQRTIAQMLGVQRTSVNKLLKEFERRNLVEIGYGMVILRDVPGLCELAEGTSPRPDTRSRLTAGLTGTAASSFAWFSIAAELSSTA